MRILILEDIGRVAESERDALSTLGHIIDSASSVARATALVAEKGVYDCIVVDLNMATTGLPPEYVAETQEGLLTGWVWLKRIILPNHPELRGRVIIYSAYTDDLYQEEKDKSSLEDMVIIPKGNAFDDSGTGDRLIEAVQQVGAKQMN